MQSRGVKAVIVGLMALMGTAPAWAHHSFAAAYDMKDAITITGKVVEVRLTNPHSHFFLDVVNAKGETEHWTFEAGTPSGMLRNGYSPQIIKQGDTVTIKGFRARSWFGLFAPRGTPEPVLARLSNAAAQAAALPEMKEKLLLVAQNVEYQSNVEFARQVRDDQIYFAQLLKDLDIKLE